MILNLDTTVHCSFYYFDGFLCIISDSFAFLPPLHLSSPSDGGGRKNVGWHLGWKSLQTDVLLCSPSVQISVFLSENRKWWALSASRRDDFALPLSGHSLIKTYESFLPLWLLWAQSPPIYLTLFSLCIALSIILLWPLSVSLFLLSTSCLLLDADVSSWSRDC